MSQCLNLWIFKEFCNLYFTKLLEDHRIPTNIDINGKLWTGRSGANGTRLRFTCRNNCEVVNLLNVFHHKVFFPFLLLLMKKTTVMKSLSIYFEHFSLTFLYSFLNILTKYLMFQSWISIILNKKRYAL